MNWNPLFIKNVRSQLRPSEVIPWFVTALILGALVCYGNYVFSDPMDRASTASIAFGIIVAAQMGALIIGALFVLNEVYRCNFSGIIDFHRISPQRPYSIVLGIFFGSPIRFHLLFATLLPFALGLGIVAGYSVSGIVLFYLSLLLTALYGQLLFMASAHSVPGKKSSGTMTAVVFGIASYFSLASLGIFTYYPAYQPNVEHLTTFFGVRIPRLTLQLISQGSLGVFLFIYAVRCVRYGAGYVYSKIASFALVSVATFLILGHTKEKFSVAAIGVLSFIIIFAIRLATPNRAHYLAGRRLSNKLKKPQRPWQDRSLNWYLSVASSLFVLVFVVVCHFTLQEQQFKLALWRSSPLWIMAILQYAFAIQYFKLKYDAKWGAHLWFALFLFWILPVAVGAILLRALTFANSLDSSALVSVVLSISGPFIAVIFSGFGEESIRQTFTIPYLVAGAVTGFSFYTCYREYEKLKKVE